MIDYMTPQENVWLTAKKPVLSLLERLGLTREEAKRNVLKLSGGQQQRVAIARALASEAPVILADEPTGNLDSKSTKEIMQILEGLHRSGRTVIIITHDNEIAEQVKRVIYIRDGRIEQDYLNEEKQGE